MKELMQLGKTIRAQREKRGLTQAELAGQLLVSFQAVSAWERGQSVPDLENAVRMSRLFRISLDLLVCGEQVPVYVGIDGGGTKTEICAFAADGTVLSRAVEGPTNPNDVGEERCCRTLSEGLSKVLKGLSAQEVFAGIAGCGAESWQKKIRSRLRPSLSCRLHVDSDAVCVLSLAPNPEKAAMVICGTGSSVFVREGQKRHQVGGWGQLFDESGSAYDVGKDAVRYGLAVRDGLEKEGPLLSLLEERLGGRINEQISQIYAGGRAYIASLSALVIEGAAKGDGVCHAILEKNADRLALLLRTACTRFGAEEFMMAGGFFKNRVYRELVEKKSGCALIDPPLPAVAGACIEALRRSGVPVPADFRENFEKSYGSL